MKTKILVVDDEADLELLIKQKFRRKIRESVYEFVFATNGQEALDRIAEHPDTDVILSDINMPVMDGLTLLTRYPRRAPGHENGHRIGLRRHGQPAHGHEPRAPSISW